MDVKHPSDPFKPPLIVNTVTTRLWLERCISQRLEKLMAEKWGYPAPRLGVKNQNPLFIEARASVFASFFKDLGSAVINDVFANRRTFEVHQDYLNTLKTGNFELKIAGKFNDNQRADLSPVIYELAKTCVDLLETLPLPHIKKQPVNAPAPTPASAPKPVAVVAAPATAIPTTAVREDVSIPLSLQEQNALNKLEAYIAAAVQSASERNIGSIIKQLKDKSKLLGGEIEALAAAASSAKVLHDSLLKQKHQDVILDGLMLAQERKRELDRQAGKASSLVTLPEPIVAAETSPSTIPAPPQETPSAASPVKGLRLLAIGLRRHVVAAAAGFIAAAAGVALAVGMTATAPKSSPAPQLAPTFKVAANPAPQALPAALPAAAEVKNTAPEAAATPAPVNPEPLPVVAVAVAVKGTLMREWDAPRPAVVKAPAKIAGVTFAHVTSDTLAKMCSEMRARNIQTWACEQQPQ